MRLAIKKPMTKNPAVKTAKKLSAVSSGRVLSQAEITADIQIFCSELCADRQKSLAFLQRAGIITSTGKLAKIYRE